MCHTLFLADFRSLEQGGARTAPPEKYAQEERKTVRQRPIDWHKPTGLWRDSMSLCFHTRLELSRRWREPTAGTPGAVCLFVYGLAASWCLNSTCEERLTAGERASRSGGARFRSSRDHCSVLPHSWAFARTDPDVRLGSFDFCTAVLTYIRKHAKFRRNSLTHTHTHLSNSVF